MRFDVRKVGPQEDFEAIPDAEFDAYINETTRFEDSDEMAQAGAEQWIERQLS